MIDYLTDCARRLAHFEAHVCAILVLALPDVSTLAVAGAERITRGTRAR